MASKVLMKVAGSIWLSNSWKQELQITEQGVEGEVIEGLRRTKMTLPYDRIAQVNLHRGLLAATLEVINKGGAGNLVVKGLDKAEGERAKSLIERHIQLARDDQRLGQQGSTPGFSIADELEKLASMRDNGILSAEEFEEQKRRLLAR